MRIALRCTIPVARYAILVVDDGLKTVSMLARILELFQESAV